MLISIKSSDCQKINLPAYLETILRICPFSCLMSNTRSRICQSSWARGVSGPGLCPPPWWSACTSPPRRSPGQCSWGRDPRLGNAERSCPRDFHSASTWQPGDKSWHPDIFCNDIWPQYCAARGTRGCAWTRSRPTRSFLITSFMVFKSFIIIKWFYLPKVSWWYTWTQNLGQPCKPLRLKQFYNCTRNFEVSPRSVVDINGMTEECLLSYCGAVNLGLTFLEAG